MINFRFIFFIFGIFSNIAGALMIIPMVVELFLHSANYLAFLKSSVIAFVVGTLLIITNYSSVRKVNKKNAFMLTAVIWILLCLLCSLPFFYYDYNGGGISFVNSFFEATSGLTTTGSSLLLNLDSLGKGILLWRAMLQFIGGVGIVIFVLLIIPSIHKGGVYLISSESGTQERALFSKSSSFIIGIIAMYLLLASICTISYYIFGMTLFDAICHAFSTVSSGGFSTHSLSLAFYKDNIGIEVTAFIFMLFSSFPFIFFIYAFKMKKLFKSSQISVFLFIIFSTSILSSIAFYFQKDLTILESIRYGFVNAASFITSTGFTNYDFSSAGGIIFALFLLISYIGGCTGSTSGGVKVSRIQTIFNEIRQKIRIESSDGRVFYSIDKSYSDLQNVATLLFFYIISFWAGVLILSLYGYDFSTAIASVSMVINNTGVGLTPVIGPSGSLNFFEDEIKILLSFLMMAGRIEFMSFYILLFPSFWKNN